MKQQQQQQQQARLTPTTLPLCKTKTFQLQVVLVACLFVAKGAVRAFVPSAVSNSHTALGHVECRSRSLSRLYFGFDPSKRTSLSEQQQNGDNHHQQDKKANGKRVVICGGGIGGLSTAFDAGHLLRSQDSVIVVSDREQFQFTPSNPWVAVRKRTPDDISLSLTKVLPRHNIEFVHGKARTLNTKMNQLVLEDGTKIPYDYLVIATGPRLGYDEIPGSRSGHSHTASICTTPHALEAADTYDRLVQEPGPVVIGATQGASCFGPAYEFALLIHYQLKKRGGRKLVEQCPIHFVTPEPYIGHLGLKGAGSSQKILTDLLEKHRIKYTTNCKIQRVNPNNSVSIQWFDENDKVHNEVLPSHLTMLVPPFRGAEAWKTIPDLTDHNGMILVNKHQQSMAYPNIFAVGICVHIDPLEETKVPTGVPKTGYMIESMGTAAAKNIRDMILHQAKQQQQQQQQGSHDDDTDKHEGMANELLHTPLLNGLCITDFGDDGAVYVAIPQIPPRRHDYTITGKIATLAKIAFEKYFLHKIESGDVDPYYEKYLLQLVGVQRTIVEK